MQIERWSEQDLRSGLTTAVWKSSAVRAPQIHLGAKALEMEARGVQTRIGNESCRIGKVDRDIERKVA